jgi:hypothetical protein
MRHAPVISIQIKAGRAFYCEAEDAAVEAVLLLQIIGGCSKYVTKFNDERATFSDLFFSL